MVKIWAIAKKGSSYDVGRNIRYLIAVNTLKLMIIQVFVEKRQPIRTI